jgi:hypothetical protein
MRGVSASTSESAVLLIPAIPKKAKRPGLVKVKRSRSTSLRTSRPSTTAEVNFFAMSDVFNQSINISLLKRLISWVNVFGHVLISSA